MKLPLLVHLSLLFLCSCQPSTSQESPRETPDVPPTLNPEILPAPFSAEQIRAGCMAGTLLMFRIEVLDQPVMVQHTAFRDGDETSATVESWMESEDGQPLGPRSTQVSSWTELRDHAVLAPGTTRTFGEFNTERGTEEGWHYIEPVDDERGTGTREFWFAQRFPGPPELLVETINGQVVLRMEMIARAMP